MKHYKGLLLAFVAVAALALTACTGAKPEPQAQPVEANPPLQVVTTIFPPFDFIRAIAGDRIALTMLISPGAESHAYEPTPRDMITLQQADLFVYVCREAEHWVTQVLGALENEDMYTTALIAMVDPLYADQTHGQNHEHSHTHSHNHGHSHGHSHDHAHHQYDEHVWTSPRNAIRIVEALTHTLSQLDPTNAYYFQSNAAAYILELEALDRALTNVVAEAARTTIVFGDRFPFAYLAHDYGLTAYAAFPGCANETYASPATIAWLIDKVNHDNIPVVFYIELSNRQIANVIAEATGATLLELHSAHNVSHTDFTAGLTYLDIMARNIEHLREALSQ